MIDGVAFCTVSDAEFPFRINMELAIDVERVYSYTWMVTVSVLSVASEKPGVASNDSSVRV